MEYKGEDKFVELLNKLPNVAVQGYNKEREVIYWNKASEKIYGYTREESLGEKLEDLIVPDLMKEIMIEGVNSWYKGGEAPLAAEYTLKHKDGSDVHVYASHVILNEGSDNPEMFCIDVDLSEKVQKDLELKEKRKILAQQSKMAAMGDMLANIAHQWRQPLSIISTSATYVKLQKQMNISSDEEIISNMDVINNSAQYLSKTIDDFMNFFKPQKNDTKFLIADVIEKTLKLINSKFITEDIEIIQNIENYELYSVENELIQVLINILNNARDILLLKENKKRLIFINTYKIDNNIYIDIKDNAGGIDDNIIDRIFEPYFTTKHQLEGTGIGLYMSLEIVTKHLNGILSVENVEYKYNDILCKGAKFTIKVEVD